MPSNPWVWIVLIIVAGAVLALALWMGRGLRARFGNKSVEVDAPEQPKVVSVAKAAELEDVEAGNVTGEKIQGGAGSSHADIVDVLEQAKVKRAKLGNITGVEQTNTPPPPKKPNANRT